MDQDAIGNSGSTQPLPHLPRELIDEILSLTFNLWTTFYSRSHVEISSGYSPPHLLHFHPTTRRSFARDYYVNTIFHCRSENLLIKWLLSLPEEHIILLRQVRYTGRVRTEHSRSSERKACEALREKVVLRLRAKWPELKDCTFLTVWS